MCGVANGFTGVSVMPLADEAAAHFWFQLLNCGP